MAEAQRRRTLPEMLAEIRELYGDGAEHASSVRGQLELDLGALPPARPLRHPERSRIESNLARRGIWQTAGGRGRSGVPYEGVDHLGPFRVEYAPLYVRDLEMTTWLCTRYAEMGCPSDRLVPFHLRQLAQDFGLSSGSNRNLNALSASLDRLYASAISTDLWLHGRHHPRWEDRFRVVARLQRPKASGPRSYRQAGVVELGSWLIEQLRPDFAAWLRWDQIRRLDGILARRMLIFLEAERIEGEKRWQVTRAFLTTLGLAANNTSQARANIEAAGREIVGMLRERYPLVRLDFSSSRRQPADLIVQRCEP